MFKKVWGDLLDRDDVLILDTETTGFHRGDAIVEIAIIDTTGGTKFQSLINPERQIPKAAQQYHGISGFKLMGAPDWTEVYPDVKSLLEGAVRVLAWNAEYDERMLKQASFRYGLPVIRARWQCAMTDYMKAMPMRRYSLEAALLNNFLTLSRKAHRAERDCLAVLEVMRHFS